MTDPHFGANCQKCRGSGYVDGPPIHETVNGLPHPYTTVTVCGHDWWHDDPWHPEDRAISQDHPKAQAALARGMAQGHADLDALRNRQPLNRKRPA
jgi:hypothetical protein